MLTSDSIRPAILMACAVALTYSVTAFADDMASFATGGYARGLQSEKLMHKIDTNGDGMISKDEWIAYQEKIFAMREDVVLVHCISHVFSNSGVIAPGHYSGFRTGTRKQVSRPANGSALRHSISVLHILGAKVWLSTNIAIILTLNCIWARLGTDRQDVAQLLLRSGFVGR